MSDEQAGGPAQTGPEREAERPVLRVVRGTPTPQEVAALVTVLAAAVASSAAATGPRGPASAWNDRARAVRVPLSPGPNAWRASALPL